jgi:hypothetical protein
MRFLLPFILFSFSLNIWAANPPRAEIQSGFNRRLIMQRPVPKGDFDRVVIPVKRVGNLLVVEATVDGIRGNFIFDTGAPYLVLNATYFRDYKEESSHVATDVTGNLSPQRTTEVERLKMMDMYYENLEADVSDLSAIENRRGIQVLGLLGVNLFMRMEVEINLRDEQIILYRTDREGHRLSLPRNFGNNGILKTFELRNNAIISNGSIGGVDLDICFDTGAEALLLDNNLPAEVFENLRIIRRSQLTGAGGRSTEVLFGALRALNFGLELQNCQMMIADLEEIGKAYGYPVDVFLGYDLLNKGVVTINFKNKELFIHAFDS